MNSGLVWTGRGRIGFSLPLLQRPTWQQPPSEPIPQSCTSNRTGQPVSQLNAGRLVYVRSVRLVVDQDGAESDPSAESIVINRLPVLADTLLSFRWRLQRTMLALTDQQRLGAGSLGLPALRRGDRLGGCSVRPSRRASGRGWWRQSSCARGGR